MKRVYLDQNKWIELLRVHSGKHRDRELAALLEVLNFGVLRGLVSLPLSSAHYQELAHRRDVDSRFELAAFMASYSNLHSIAPRQALLQWEIEAALSDVFGAPKPAGSPQPFGFGMAHAFGVRQSKVPDGVKSAAELLERHAPGSGYREILEVQVLAGPHPQEEAEMDDYDPLCAHRFGKHWAGEREARRRRIARDGWHRGEASKRLAKVEAWAADGETISQVMRRLGLDPALVGNLGQEGITALLEAIPLSFVASEMVRLREVADVRPWSGHDLTDIEFLGPAVVYCDVVVTEKLWVSFIHRAGFEERYGTRAVSRLADLARLLV